MGTLSSSLVKAGPENGLFKLSTAFKVLSDIGAINDVQTSPSCILESKVAQLAEYLLGRSPQKTTSRKDAAMENHQVHHHKARKRRVPLPDSNTSHHSRSCAFGLVSKEDHWNFSQGDSIESECYSLVMASSA